MKTNPFINTILWSLVVAGFIGGFKVSIENFNGMACPSFFSLPICYVVTAAYGLILGSLAINNKGCKHHFFCAGWGVAFTIALFASLAEYFGGGGICPSSNGGIRAGQAAGIPLCYISLVMLAAILILFISGPYRKLCENVY